MSIVKLVLSVTIHTSTETQGVRKQAETNQPADVLDCGDPISFCIPLFKKGELVNCSTGGRREREREILTVIELYWVLQGLHSIVLDWEFI